MCGTTSLIFRLLFRFGCHKQSCGRAEKRTLLERAPMKRRWTLAQPTLLQHYLSMTFLVLLLRPLTFLIQTDSAYLGTRAPATCVLARTVFAPPVRLPRS